MVERDKKLKRLTAKELDRKFDKGEEDTLKGSSNYVN